MTDWIVSISTAAKSDIRQARDWYESQHKGLGIEFLSVIAEGMLRLQIAPDSHPLYYREYRRLALKRFPFKLFYIIAGKKVIVFRVLHSSRDHNRELK